MGASVQLTGARRVSVAVLVGLLLLVVGPAHGAPGAAPTGSLAHGECTFASVAVTFTPQLRSGLAAVSLSASGTGDCLINGNRVTAPFTLTASSDVVGFSCGAGSATGSATLALPGPYALLAGVARVVNAGGVVTVAFAGGGAVVGGAFSQAETASCLLAPRTTASWTGALAF
jgi:hypothetical protein